VTSASSVVKVNGLVLSNCWPAVRLRIGSIVASPGASSSVALASTAALVGSRTASRRRSTSSGGMTEPYSWGLKWPRSLSATFHTKAALAANPAG
jgi:hypothetical protein